MTDSRDLALKCIGRNVVNFQKLEGMLKVFLQSNDFSCPVSKIQETLDLRKKSFEKQSFGNLVKEYFRIAGNRSKDELAVPDEVEEAWVSLSFKIEGEQGLSSEQKSAITFLVSERNKLIHQILPSVDLESEESCKALIGKLEEQNQLLKTHYIYLQELIGAIKLGNQLLLNEFIQLHVDTVRDR